MALDPTGDIVTLLGDLVDIPSESRGEGAIADAIEAALAGAAHLTVERDGNTLVARTHLGHPDRVLICGHIDTVPEADNLPHHIETVDGEERLVGLGSCDMKGGVAVALALAVAVEEPTRDITYVFYEAEEIEERYNGLKRLAETRPDLLAGDFAVLMEPSDAGRRGRLPGDPARGDPPDRPARPQCALVAGQQRDPFGRRRPGAAGRVPAVPGGDRRPGVPRGPQRRGHHRGSGRQRDPR